MLRLHLLDVTIGAQMHHGDKTNNGISNFFIFRQIGREGKRERGIDNSNKKIETSNEPSVRYSNGGDPERKTRATTGWLDSGYNLAKSLSFARRGTSKFEFEYIKRCPRLARRVGATLSI